MNIDKNRLIIAVLLSVSVSTVMHFELFIPIVGTDVATDPREIFLLPRNCRR